MPCFFEFVPGPSSLDAPTPRVPRKYRMKFAPRLRLIACGEYYSANTDLAMHLRGTPRPSLHSFQTPHATTLPQAKNNPRNRPNSPNFPEFTTARLSPASARNTTRSRASGVSPCTNLDSTARPAGQLSASRNSFSSKSWPWAGALGALGRSKNGLQTFGKQSVLRPPNQNNHPDLAPNHEGTNSKVVRAEPSPITLQTKTRCTKYRSRLSLKVALDLIGP